MRLVPKTKTKKYFSFGVFRSIEKSRSQAQATGSVPNFYLLQKSLTHFAYFRLKACLFTSRVFSNWKDVKVAQWPKIRGWPIADSKVSNIYFG